MAVLASPGEARTNSLGRLAGRLGLVAANSSSSSSYFNLATKLSALLVLKQPKVTGTSWVEATPVGSGVSFMTVVEAPSSRTISEPEPPASGLSREPPSKNHGTDGPSQRSQCRLGAEG